MTLDSALASGDLFAVATALTKHHIKGCPSAPCKRGPYSRNFHFTCASHDTGQWMPDFDCCTHFNPTVCACEAIKTRIDAIKENAA